MTDQDDRMAELEARVAELEEELRQIPRMLRETMLPVLMQQMDESYARTEAKVYEALAELRRATGAAFDRVRDQR
jgi:N-methylhydantoinase B/oxoprolinase/acetone carboxylase alpha subunit